MPESRVDRPPAAARPQPPGRPLRFDLELVLRLLRHEAAVHAVPDRRIRELGDAFLLHDPVDPEPFWNRLEGVRFPDAPDAFDRRLAEVGILFAGIARQPHIWLMPPFDQPPDLLRRLLANGFEDAGAGHLMATTGSPALGAVVAASSGADVAIERISGMTGRAAMDAAMTLVTVLLAAFDVGEDRRPGVIVETLASLRDSRFTHYLVRLDGRPAAVARRATFDGLSYLSSIGTTPSARGRGLGTLVTAMATSEALAAGSEMVHLGVFADNTPAKRLYERLGFQYVGEPGPDMILIG